LKHAGSETLDRLEHFLSKLRTLPGLVEKKRGTFYKKSSAFLHFHEDPAGIFADIKVDGHFKRFSANTPEQQERLLDCAKKILSA
jgi:hypothetical protein